MKKRIILLLLICSSSIFINAQSIKNINLQKSTITWEGSKLFSFGKHDGTVKFTSGFFKLYNDKIVGGEFIVNMKSIASNENKKWATKLVNHLKGEDFFNIKKYPTTKIIFTNVKHVGDGYMQITADLTIHEITNSVFFVAKLNDEKTQFETRLKIDRTDWNITYKSKGKTSIKDHIISDAISFEINLNF